jgi:cytochrome c
VFRPNVDRSVAEEAETAPRGLSVVEPRLRALIEEGEAFWRQPPLADNAIPCATCHFDGAEFEGWAASFPKVKPMPTPFTRVMTLQQAVGESVATHYRIPPGSRNQQVSRAITAYLTWIGEGRPLTPGVAARQPIFPDRMAALQESIARGETRVRRSCARCHADPARFGEVAATFPRVPRAGAAVMTLEEYLQGHTGPAWDSPEAADIAAFVAARARGRTLQPGGASKP